MKINTIQQFELTVNLEELQMLKKSLKLLLDESPYGSNDNIEALNQLEQIDEVLDSL